MKRKSRIKLLYKVDRRNIESYQIVLSRFSPKINDFNVLLLCVGEALIRLGKVTNGTILSTVVDYAPDLNRTLSFESSVYPALAQFLDRTVWGNKEKALGIIMGEAVKFVAISGPGDLDSMIAIGSAPWEELSAYALPDDYSQGVVSSTHINHKRVDAERLIDNAVAITEREQGVKESEEAGSVEKEKEEVEMDVDMEMLSGLAEGFDIDIIESFDGTDVDEFQS
jgi:hypothetical protein